VKGIVSSVLGIATEFGVFEANKVDVVRELGRATCDGKLVSRDLLQEGVQGLVKMRGEGVIIPRQVSGDVQELGYKGREGVLDAVAHFHLHDFVFGCKGFVGVAKGSATVVKDGYQVREGFEFLSLRVDPESAILIVGVRDRRLGITGEATQGIGNLANLCGEKLVVVCDLLRHFDNPFGQCRGGTVEFLRVFELEGGGLALATCSSDLSDRGLEPLLHCLVRVD